jgi:hypothetical protein
LSACLYCWPEILERNSFGSERTQGSEIRCTKDQPYAHYRRAASREELSPGSMPDNVIGPTPNG